MRSLQVKWKIGRERQTHRSKGQENSVAGGERCERWLWGKGCVSGVEAGGTRHTIRCTKLVFPGATAWWPLFRNIPRHVFRIQENPTGIREKANNRAVLSPSEARRHGCQQGPAGPPVAQPPRPKDPGPGPSGGVIPGTCASWAATFSRLL